MAQQSIVRLDNVSYQYQMRDNEQIDTAEQVQSVLAISNLSFTIKRGQWVAIVGHNGSGKSTLAKLLCAVNFATEGQVIIDDKIVDASHIEHVRQQVGIVFQNPDNQFVGATVEDDIAFGLENHGIDYDTMHQRVDDALAKVKMQDFKYAEPAKLSGGQKQRVAIAGVIALRPDIIILDEATAMLDPEGRQEIIEVIHQLRKENNLTVLSITHDLEEAASADHILVMNKGRKFAEGTPQEVFALGQQLVDLGLDLPFEYRLQQHLQREGVNFDALTNPTEEGVLTQLCKSLSTK